MRRTIDLNDDLPSADAVTLSARLDHLVGTVVKVIDTISYAFDIPYVGILRQTDNGTLWLETASGASCNVSPRHCIEVVEGGDRPIITIRAKPPKKEEN